MFVHKLVKKDFAPFMDADYEIEDLYYDKANDCLEIVIDEFPPMAYYEGQPSKPGAYFADDFTCTFTGNDVWQMFMIERFGNEYAKALYSNPKKNVIGETKPYKKTRLKQLAEDPAQTRLSDYIEQEGEMNSCL